MKFKRLLWFSLFIALLCLIGYIYQMTQAFKSADVALDGETEAVTLHLQQAIQYRNSGFLIALAGTAIFFYTNRSKG
ncbi:MAG: hypothetical protein ACN4GF_12510 [Lentimonas sp.]